MALIPLPNTIQNALGPLTCPELAVSLRQPLALVGPGRTIYEFYQQAGNLLDRSANRLAHRFGRGPLALQGRIEFLFEKECDRETTLQGLRSAGSVPLKVRKCCITILRFALPSESACTQVDCFKAIISLSTRYPGLRRVFLEILQSEQTEQLDRDTILSLWRRTDTFGTLEDFTFASTCAAECLAERCISAIVEVDSGYPLWTVDSSQAGYEFTVVERLAIACACGADSELSTRLAVRYLAGIIAATGFWIQQDPLLDSIVLKLIRVARDLVCDLGIDELAGPFTPPSPAHDVEGVDLLCSLILFGVQDAEISKALGVWHSDLSELVLLLRHPRAEHILPVSWDVANSPELQTFVPSSFRVQSVQGLLLEKTSPPKPPRSEVFKRLFALTSAVSESVFPPRNPDYMDILRDTGSQYEARSRRSRRSVVSQASSLPIIEETSDGKSDDSILDPPSPLSPLFTDRDDWVGVLEEYADRTRRKSRRESSSRNDRSKREARIYSPERFVDTIIAAKSSGAPAAEALGDQTQQISQPRHRDSTSKRSSQNSSKENRGSQSLTSKNFKVSIDDPAWKVLPAALHKYRIGNDDWENYAMFICYTNSAAQRIERCLSYDEKPLLLFQRLKIEGKDPVFMLKHIQDIRSPVSVAKEKNAARKAVVAPPAAEDAAHDVAALNVPAQSTAKRTNMAAEGYAVAIYPYMADQTDELDIVVGDTFIILSRARGWWVVQRDPTGMGATETDFAKQGWVPSGCLLEIKVPVASATAEANTATTSMSDPIRGTAPISAHNIISTSFLGVALMDYDRKGEEELSLRKDEALRVFKRYNHWSYAVKVDSGNRGWVPSWFVGKTGPIETGELPSTETN
ncbi:hypothetical protein MKEN_00719000 [Mycena kentingensis (nom. inval.)]|nr:hypothetical protein MKEN_00719000 [Mycena kentingensis (nom. inval.)]